MPERSTRAEIGVFIVIGLNNSKANAPSRRDREWISVRSATIMIATGEDVDELVGEQQRHPHGVHGGHEQRVAGLLDQGVGVERPEPVARTDPRRSLDEPLVVDGQ